MIVILSAAKDPVRLELQASAPSKGILHFVQDDERGRFSGSEAKDLVRLGGRLRLSPAGSISRLAITTGPQAAR